MGIFSYKFSKEINKIDKLATDGLAGINNSLSYRIHEIEKHFHNRELWIGKLGSQTATAWADDTLSPFRAISGNNDYGADTNDEALILGTDDTPINSEFVKFDLHWILITALSTDTPWKLRFIWGSGTMADAILANQWSEIMAQNNPNGSKANGAAIPIMMPRLNCGIDKVWAQVWNATDNATADFLVGFHEYLG